MRDLVPPYNPYQVNGSSAAWWDELKESPCLMCKLPKKPEPMDCKLQAHCPMNIPTVLSTAFHVDARLPRGKAQLNNVCKFPGCTKLCPNIYCNGKNGHSQLVYRRKCLWPGMPIEFYHLSPKRLNFGDSLMKRWERMQAEKKHTN